MEKLTTFEEFLNGSQLNEGRGADLTKEQLEGVNSFLKSLGVKKLVDKKQYIDGQGGYTSIGQTELRDKDLGDFAASFTVIQLNRHISVERGNVITLMIDTIAKTHNREFFKTTVFWISQDNGKTFKIR